MLPSVKKRRDQLYKDNKEALDRGDAVTAVKISDELIKMAKEELKNDPGMQVYDSECKPKFSNVYRAMFITRGPTWNETENKFDISKGAFIDGMSKDDFVSYGNGVINGAYPKAIGTSDAGYETKKMFAMNQAISVGPRNGDCKSKFYREVVVTKKNADKLIKRYYLNGSKLELLEMDTVKRLIGKTIKIRSPLYCCAESGTICNKCAGELPYILGIKNIGLTSSSIGSGYLNLLMKAFHDTTQKLTTVNIDRMIIE